MEAIQVLFSTTIVSPFFDVVYEEGFHTAVDVFLIWWPTVFNNQVFQFLFSKVQTECPTENLSVFFSLRAPFREFFFSWVEFWFRIYLDFFNGSVKVWTCDFTRRYSFSPLSVKGHRHFFIQRMFWEVIVECSCDSSICYARLCVTDCFIGWIFHVKVEVCTEWYFLRHFEDNLVTFVDWHWVWELDVFKLNFKVDVFTSSVTVSALFEVHVDVRVFDSNCRAFFWNFSWRFFNSWCFFCCVSCCFCGGRFRSCFWCRRYSFWGWCFRSCFCCRCYGFSCWLCRSNCFCDGLRRSHGFRCWLSACHLISVGVWCHDCK